MPFVIKSPKIYFNGRFISCYTNNLSLNIESAEQNVTTLGSTKFEEYVSGNARWNMDYSGYYVSGENEIEPLYFNSIGSTGNNVMVVPSNNATTGSYAYFGNAISSRYQSLGNMGEVNPLSISMIGNGNIYDGTVVLMKPISSSGYSDVYDLGTARTTGDQVHAMKQIVNCASSGSMVSIIQANSSSGFTVLNPGIDIITFDNSTGIDSELKSGEVSLGQRFYRVNFGTTGLTPNKEFESIIAVAVGDEILDHNQNTDQYLDLGGANQVAVADVKDAVTKKHANTLDHSNALDHSQGTDQGLDNGGANATTAAEVKSAVDLKHANTLDHTQGTDTALGTVGTKNPVIDADLVISRDSTASNALVTSTWAQIKAFLKTYFDDIYGSTTPPNLTSIRQTVLAGMVDANNLPSALVDGGVLDIDLVCTTPLQYTIANGYNSAGNVDYCGEIAATVESAWTLPENQKSYLYMERNPETGVITYDETPTRPQYGMTFDATLNALLHCEGAAASDEYENACTLTGHAARSSTQKRYGTYSYNLPGTDDCVDITGITTLGGAEWAIQWSVRPDGVGVNQFLGGCKNQYGVKLHLPTADKKLRLYLSSNNTSHDIHNGTTAGVTVFAATTWYDLAVTYDGSNYRAFSRVAGSGAWTLEITVASATLVYGVLTGFRFGADHTPANGMAGYIDEIRITVGDSRLIGDCAEAEAAWSPDTHWFDPQEQKMKYGCPASWAYKQRVFCGEALAHVDHIDSVTTYAYKGEAMIDSAVLATSQMIITPHLVGTIPRKINVTLVNIIAEFGYYPGEEVDPSAYYSDSNHAFFRAYSFVKNNKNIITFTSNYPLVVHIKNSGALMSITMGSWKWRIRCKV
jgi:hypothetical protein